MIHLNPRALCRLIWTTIMRIFVSHPRWCVKGLIFVIDLLRDDK
ncbi:hypothetical protein WM008_20495 [Vibrio vulnificus]|nr:hypothetical protein [Vibrio vulnificus]